MPGINEFSWSICGIKLGRGVKGNSTAWKTAVSFPNISSCQSSLGHLGRGRKGIWTLKNSDRKPGIQDQETVSQQSRPKWEGCNLCQNNKGTTRSDAQTGGRRWQMLAQRALWGVDAQHPGFLFPEAVLASYQALERNQKRERREEEKGKKQTAAFLYNNNNTLSWLKKRKPQQIKNRRERPQPDKEHPRTTYK